MPSFRNFFARFSPTGLAPPGHTNGGGGGFVLSDNGSETVVRTPSAQGLASHLLWSELGESEGDDWAEAVVSFPSTSGIFIAGPALKVPLGGAWDASGNGPGIVAGLYTQAGNKAVVRLSGFGNYLDSAIQIDAAPGTRVRIRIWSEDGATFTRFKAAAAAGGGPVVQTPVQFNVAHGVGVKHKGFAGLGQVVHPSQRTTYVHELAAGGGFAGGRILAPSPPGRSALPFFSRPLA